MGSSTDAPRRRIAGRLRRSAGALRHRPRCRSRRSRHAARPQRHGQNHHRQRDLRPASPQGRPYHVRRQGSDGQPAVRDRPARPRPRARGPPGVPDAKRGGKPDRDGRRPLRTRPLDSRPRLRVFPAPAGAPRQPRQPAFGRRAADARHRPRLDDQPQAARPRRGDRGPRPLDPRRDLGMPAASQIRGPVDHRHRQEHPCPFEAGGPARPDREGPRGLARLIRSSEGRPFDSRPVSARRRQRAGCEYGVATTSRRKNPWACHRASPKPAKASTTSAGTFSARSTCRSR